MVADLEPGKERRSELRKELERELPKEPLTEERLAMQREPRWASQLSDHRDKEKQMAK
jgi:hypothetical protein